MQKCIFPFGYWLLIAMGLCPAHCFAQQVGIDFNRDIRPILSENCFYCHGQDSNKRQADLRLDRREEALQTNSIVPGSASKSKLIERILSQDANHQMPPPQSNRKLTAEQKSLLQNWIEQGAEYATHWAFATPIRPDIPSVHQDSWTRNPIDLFVLAKIEQQGLRPSPEADRVTLIKRLYSDLIGLPPDPQAIDEFVASPSESAYEDLVEELMQNPHYGERMSLGWLDAARYADSNGFQQDGDTWQWLWRDWVVRSLNQNLPFDQFTIWQLAGDLLPNSTEEQKIASGFNRNHLLNGEGGAIPEEQRFVILFDRMDTTATTWLGLTMACAQCHDHKYDPLTQKDYYRLMDAFNRVPESGVPQFFSSRIRVAAPFIELPTEENKRRVAEFESQIEPLEKEVAPIADAAFVGWRSAFLSQEKPEDAKGIPASLATLLRKAESERTDADKSSIETQLRKHFEDKVRSTLGDRLPNLAKWSDLKKQLAAYKADQIPRAMVMSDERPRQTSILTRGEYLKPGETVSFGVPEFLPGLPKDAPQNRLGFAQWLLMPEHPLTARVQVNRMWQYYFGNALVKTSEDFGVQSEYPIHMNLLDWLAVEFRETGWDMKRMHRLILNSATYRQSSRVDSELRIRDPENRLYARASRFRMPAMVLRDWALFASDLIDFRMGGAPVYPYQPDAIWESLAITKERDFTYPASKGGDLYRRSVYTFWRRTVGPANMFDASNRQTCRVRNTLTSTPLHALTMLNDPTWVEAARVLAERAAQSASDLNGQLQFAFRRVLGRLPQNRDLLRLEKAYHRQLEIYREDVGAAQKLLSVGESPPSRIADIPAQAALCSVCLLLLNLDEAMTRE